MVNGGRGRRWLWVVAGIAGAGALLAVVAIWHLPARMYRDAGDAEARAALQGGLLTAAAALTAVAGGLIALDETRRSNRDTHVRELYATAIGLLGAEGIDSRLGGIYALERIAVDSRNDQRSVVEVLSAFVREHTRQSPAIPARMPPGRRWDRAPARTATRNSGGRAAPYVTTDVQAAVTVLGRLPDRAGVPRADLSDAILSGAKVIVANFNEADLSRADLTSADLSGAKLNEADLSRADLSGAILSGIYIAAREAFFVTDLSGAALYRAKLHRANLSYANLSGADLAAADLSHADVSYAILGDADLSHADLSYANLGGARLAGAALVGAVFSDVDLSDVKGLNDVQIAEATGNTGTRLPPGIARPASWPAEIR